MVCRERGCKKLSTIPLTPLMEPRTRAHPTIPRRNTLDNTAFHTAKMMDVCLRDLGHIPVVSTSPITFGSRRSPL